MSTLATTNIKHPSSASNNIVLDSSGGVDLDALTVSGSAPADSVNIDASGRLLVGTSTARSWGGETPITQIENAGFAGLSLTANNNGTNSPYIQLGKTRSSTNGGNAVVANGDKLGELWFVGGDGTQLVSGASIKTEVDGTPGTNDMPGRLVFSTTADGASSPTERVRITNVGQFNAFSSTAVSTIIGRNSQGAGTTVATFIGAHSATGTTDGTISCYIWSNGNIQNTNGSYTTISDAKLKENIVDAGSQWGDIKAIQIRNWNFKAETGHETHRQIGPIAQELETVCPGLVFETSDRDTDGNETGEVTKGVNQSVLYMKAVKALQEAMERIEVLEQRLTDAGIA